jgi:hypothetical protein
MKMVVSNCVLLLGLEIVASLLVWASPPTDWTGKPPSFWLSELSRLRYWTSFLLLAALIWTIVWRTFHLRVGSCPWRLFGLFLAFMIEGLTSFFYWRHLTWQEASILGWSHFPQYFWEHFVGWTVLMLLALSLRFLLEQDIKVETPL